MSGHQAFAIVYNSASMTIFNIPLAFLMCDAMLAWYWLSSFVCVSGTCWYCLKMAKCRIMQTMPLDSTGTLLIPKVSAKFDQGHPQERC